MPVSKNLQHTAAANRYHRSLPLERTPKNQAKALTRQELAKAEARAITIPRPALTPRSSLERRGSMDTERCPSPDSFCELASRAMQPARRRSPSPSQAPRHPSPLRSNPPMRPPSISSEEQLGLRIAAIRLKLQAAQKIVLSILDASDAVDANVLAQVADAAVSLRTAAAYIRPPRLTPLCPDDIDGLIFQFALEEHEPCLPISEVSSR